MMLIVPETVYAESELSAAPTVTIDEDGVATWTDVDGAADY